MGLSLLAGGGAKQFLQRNTAIGGVASALTRKPKQSMINGPGAMPGTMLGGAGLRGIVKG